MIHVSSRPLPEQALLHRHAVLAGVQSDAHCVCVPGPVSIAAFVTAFFTSRAFAPEALILRLTLRRATGPVAVAALAEARSSRYAAWHVEERDDTQLLMAVGTGPIRSWWMVCPMPSGKTELWFGSAILPVKSGTRVSVGFRLLNRFHLTYARFLLRGAAKALRASAATVKAR